MRPKCDYTGGMIYVQSYVCGSVQLVQSQGFVLEVRKHGLLTLLFVRWVVIILGVRSDVQDLSGAFYHFLLKLF